jgi:YD repeat-containing protein
VNGTPTPDYVPPQPEWTKGNPDDLNDAEYWPTLDLPLMQDSAEVPIRFFNGELQLRMKDLGSDGFGVPWGHTRIYSNRLSNSYDFGNGYNWLVHEWPQLVRRKTDPAEVTKLHPPVKGEPTGCTLIVLRGTRNALWFDEFRIAENCKREWRPRFGAKQTLEVDGQFFRLTGPNGHAWKFHAFSPNCFETRKTELYTSRDSRLNGKFVQHLAPGGQSIAASYKDGALDKVERTAAGTTERFEYAYYEQGGNCGRLRYVTWVRGEKLRRAEYTYYDSGEPCGNLGDLKSARTAVWTSTGWRQRENAIQYFRYEKQPKDTYCQGMLQCVVGPEAFHRLIEDKGIHPFQASDADIRCFADLYVDYYDASDPFLARRVRTLTLFGGGRQHTFTYAPESLKRPTLPPGHPGYNHHHTLTTETRVDESKKEVSSNFIGQTLFLRLSADSRHWTHNWIYDDDHAGVIAKFEPSGKFHKLGFRRVPENRAFLNLVEVGKTVSGSEVPLKEFTYAEVNQKYGIYAIDTETTIGVGMNRDATQDAVIEFQYQWAGLGHMSARTTILPLVRPTHFANATRYDNGTTRRSMSEVFDVYGNAVRITDLRNTLTMQEMDVAKGVPIREVVTFRDRDRTQQQLVFSYKSDPIGRVTQVLGPVHRAIIPGSELEQPVRAATWYLYKDLSGEIWTAQGYVSAGAERLVNPVQIRRYDRANRVTDSIAAVRTGLGRPSIQESLSQRTWIRWVHQEYNSQRTMVTNRVYHKIPVAFAGQGEAAGRPEENYNETITTSDIAARRKMVSVAGGTRYETLFEGRGLPIQLRTGTSSGQMSHLVEMEYDDNGTGNGNLTQIRRWDGKNLRVTSFGYDPRDRQNMVTEADGGRIQYVHNNQNTIARMTRSANGITLAERAQLIDVRGRIYASQLMGPRGQIVELTLYDNANQVIAVEPHGRVGPALGSDSSRPLVLYQHDGLGRESLRRVVVEMNGEESTFTQVETYRNESGDPILVTARGRFPDGELQGLTKSGPLGSFQGTIANGLPGATSAHVSHVATWYDPLGRRVATADYGAAIPGGGRFRPTAIPSPQFESVVRYDYDAGGELSTVVDPMRHLSHFGYDHAGRLSCQATNISTNQFNLLQNYSIGASGVLQLSDDATVSQFGYTPENKLTRSVFHNTHTRRQTTDVLYGANGTGPFPPTAHLPREVIDAEGRRLLYDYNGLGEVVRVTDANGTVHEYEYDRAGRVVVDRVVQCDLLTIDGKVRRIEYKYDQFGRLDGITSYDAPTGGSIVNYVRRKYGNFNELIIEAQLHSRREGFSGAPKYHGDAETVPTLNLDSDPGHIGYYYDYPDSNRNVHRLRTVWYPGDRAQHRRGRWLTVEYANSLAQTLGRISGIAENRTFITSPIAIRPVRYDYWAERSVYGLDFVNARTVPAIQDGVRVLSNLSLGFTAPFSSTDKLGRERHRKWKRRTVSKLTTLVSVTSLVELEVGRDFNDNLLYRKDRQALTGRDDLLVYDRLDRLLSHDRGSLNVGLTGITPASRSTAQRWRRDQSGNWRRFQRQQLLTGLGFDQHRRHSRTDHVFHLTTTGGTAWASPQHDAAGNMTRLPQPDTPSASYFAKYDAWNRMTELTDRAGRRFGYEYDGLGRRIVQRSAFDNEVRHYYYDQAGRVITEGIELQGKVVLDREYIWDVNSAQRLICRIRHNVPGQPIGQANERLYALHDMLGNVVALVDEGGDVKERYVYEPQGTVTYLNPDFSDKAQQVSAFDWEYYVAGMRRDGGSGLYFTGGGYYHVALGRILPSGPVPVLPESQLNAYAQDFPFGAWRPAMIPGMSTLEPMLKWLQEQGPWVKFTIGAVAMAGTAVYTAAWLAHGNPYGFFVLAGGLAGGIQGGIEAALAGGDFGDVMLTAGLGAAFGAIAPWGGIAGLAGSAAFGGIALAMGKDRDTIATAYQWGGLVGGLVGDYSKGALAAGKFFTRRALQAGLIHVGPDLLGAGAGAIISYSLDGTSTSALHGATLGMMAGGIAGGLARGLPSVRRATESTIFAPKGLTHLTTKASYEAIVEGRGTAGKIGGKWGIFALDSAKVPGSRFWRSFNTLVPGKLTHSIDIPTGAISAFTRPIGWGPFSAYRRWVAGVHSTPLGSIDVHAGTFIRGEIFKNGIFRQATRGEWMKYYGHQFILDYGIDAGLYGIAGLGTAIYVGPQGIIDGYNWLRGDDQ